MSRESLVFVIGFIVFLTPFLGVPREWKEYIFISSGFLLMVVGYLLRRGAFMRSIDMGKGERRSDAFVESVSFRENVDSNADE